MLTRDVGQFIERGRLRWGSEGRCEDCRAGWCEQGSGPVTPEYIRHALLQVHGPAQLRLTGEAPSLVLVLKALREAQELPMGEARARAAQLAASGLVGTLVEMEFLAIHLRKQAVAVAVDLRAV
ncbi:MULTISPECIES: hypothetical protein [Streptomyces]|uniref:Uncharacterized protein n=1 Tax=Streptomyces violaceoruber TaxID=1935 RepID=A0ACD4WQY0_STRVN|nr:MULTISPECIES: hypothetical protein [Streptomyces anthocyanicus group]WOY99959.1 hypothetical protein R2E43_21910 [Streptomyces violaceoruber]BDD72811.1 hypothetical protein JCM4020_34310 [Streptomyces coelicolor]